MPFKMDKTIDDIAKKIVNKEIELNYNGHFGNVEIKDEQEMYFILDRMSTHIILSDRLTHILGGKKDPLDVIFPEEKREFAREDCWVCGKEVQFYTEGKKIFVETECEYKDGFPEIEVEIDVPSGMLVLYNGLRRFFPKEPGRYVNYLSEVKLESEDYAKLGMIHIYTGNTSPNIYQVNDSHLIIGNDYSEDEEVVNIEGKVVGSICTDLWWYSAVDKDLFEKNAKMTLDEFDESEKKRGCWTRLNRIKVKSGRYKATGRHHLIGEWTEDLTHEVYSEIILID